MSADEVVKKDGMRGLLMGGLLFVLLAGPFDEGAGRDLLPLTLLGLAALGLGMAVVRGWIRAEFPVAQSPMTWPVAALAAVAAASMVWSIDRFVTGTGVVRVAACAASFFVIVNVLRGERDGRTICLALVALGCVLAPLGIFQTAAGRGLFTEGAVARAHAVFVTPNTFAAFLIVVLPMALGFAWRAESRAARVGFGAMFLLLLVTLVLTQSRGAWVTGGIGLAVFVGLMARRLRRRLKPALVLGGLAVLVLVGAMVYPTTRERILSMVHPLQAGAMQDRLHYWGSAWAIFRDNAPLGVGLDAFHLAYPAYQHPSLAGTTQWYAHNDLLQTLAELGVPGLVVVVWLLWAMGRTAVAALKISSDRTTVAACVAGSAAALLHGVVEYNFYVPAIALSVAACFGVIAAAESRMRPARAVSASRVPCSVRAAGSAAVVAAGVVCASFMVRPLAAQRMLEPSVWNAPMAVKVCPWSSNFWIELGRSRLQANELAGARDAFERAVECSPRSAVANVYLSKGWAVDASVSGGPHLLYLERAVALDPNAAVPRSWLAEEYAKSGLMEKARAEARVCLDRCRPTGETAHRLMHLLGEAEE